MGLRYFSSSVNSFFKHACAASQPSNGARYLIFGRNLHLLPYFICATSQGSGETARMPRLNWDFAVTYVVSTIIACAGSYIWAHVLAHIWADAQADLSLHIYRPWQNQQNHLCTQWRLRSAWASTQTHQSSLCSLWVAKDPNLLQADNKDSDQTGQMTRLIWVFAGWIGHLLVLSCYSSFIIVFLYGLNTRCPAILTMTSPNSTRSATGSKSTYYRTCISDTEDWSFGCCYIIYDQLL